MLFGGGVGEVANSEQHKSSSDTARNTASVRVPTSSFKKICLTCVLTVSGEILKKSERCFYWSSLG